MLDFLGKGQLYSLKKGISTRFFGRMKKIHSYILGSILISVTNKQSGNLIRKPVDFPHRRML